MLSVKAKIFAKQKTFIPEADVWFLVIQDENISSELHWKKQNPLKVVCWVTTPNPSLFWECISTVNTPQTCLCSFLFVQVDSIKGKSSQLDFFFYFTFFLLKTFHLCFLKNRGTRAVDTPLGIRRLRCEWRVTSPTTFWESIFNNKRETNSLFTYTSKWTKPSQLGVA